MGAVEKNVLHALIARLAERLDRGDAHRRKVVREVVHQRLQGIGMTVFAECLGRGGTDPDVGVFQRTDQRIETLCRKVADDGVDRRQPHGRRLVGKREHQLIGELLLAELAHQRDGLLPNDGIAVLRSQQQLVVISVSLDVDENGERVELHRDRLGLQKPADPGQYVALPLRKRGHERGDGVDRGLLRGYVGIVELGEQVVDRAGIRDLAQRFDRQTADHGVVVVEQRQDVGTGIATADDVQHAQQQGDDLVLFRGAKHFQDGRHGAGAEVDQGLRRRLGRIRMLEAVHQLRQCSQVA